MRNTKTREGFEWWDKFRAIPTFIFTLHKEDEIHSVRKVAHCMGTHIEQHAASVIVDEMQDEINELRVEKAALAQALENFIRVEDAENKLLIDKPAAVMAARQVINTLEI